MFSCLGCMMYLSSSSSNRQPLALLGSFRALGLSSCQADGWLAAACGCSATGARGLSGEAAASWVLLMRDKCRLRARCGLQTGKADDVGG